MKKTLGRDVYAHKEALEDHFNKIGCQPGEGLKKIEFGPNAGKVNTHLPI